MLQNTFKASSELGIESDTRDALIEVLRRLESGELKHFKPNKYMDLIPPDSNDWFNMGVWKCGTVHCLGGEAENIMGKDISVQDKITLKRLFYPWNVKFEYRNWTYITAEHAAGTLRHYLETGKIVW